MHKTINIRQLFFLISGALTKSGGDGKARYEVDDYNGFTLLITAHTIGRDSYILEMWYGGQKIRAVSTNLHYLEPNLFTFMQDDVFNDKFVVNENMVTDGEFVVKRLETAGIATGTIMGVRTMLILDKESNTVTITAPSRAYVKKSCMDEKHTNFVAIVNAMLSMVKWMFRYHKDTAPAEKPKVEGNEVENYEKVVRNALIAIDKGEAYQFGYSNDIYKFVLGEDGFVYLFKNGLIHDSIKKPAIMINTIDTLLKNMGVTRTTFGDLVNFVVTDIRTNTYEFKIARDSYKIALSKTKRSVSMFQNGQLYRRVYLDENTKTMHAVAKLLKYVGYHWLTPTTTIVPKPVELPKKEDSKSMVKITNLASTPDVPKFTKKQITDLFALNDAVQFKLNNDVVVFAKLFPFQGVYSRNTSKLAVAIVNGGASIGTATPLYAEDVGAGVSTLLERMLKTPDDIITDLKAVSVDITVKDVCHG